MRLTEFAQLNFPKGGLGGKPAKKKAIFFSKFNFLLNALGFRLVNPFPAEL